MLPLRCAKAKSVPSNPTASRIGSTWRPLHESRMIAAATPATAAAIPMRVRGLVWRRKAGQVTPARITAATTSETRSR
jgi:hypothetical protein